MGKGFQDLVDQGGRAAMQGKGDLILTYKSS